MIFRLIILSPEVARELYLLPHDIDDSWANSGKVAMSNDSANTSAI